MNDKCMHRRKNVQSHWHTRHSPREVGAGEGTGQWKQRPSQYGQQPRHFVNTALTVTGAGCGDQPDSLGEECQELECPVNNITCAVRSTETGHAVHSAPSRVCGTCCANSQSVWSLSYPYFSQRSSTQKQLLAVSSNQTPYAAGHCETCQLDSE